MKRFGVWQKERIAVASEEFRKEVTQCWFLEGRRVVVVVMLLEGYEDSRVRVAFSKNSRGVEHISSSVIAETTEYG